MPKGSANLLGVRAKMFQNPMKFKKCTRGGGGGAGKFFFVDPPLSITLMRVGNRSFFSPVFCVSVYDGVHIQGALKACNARN